MSVKITMVVPVYKVEQYIDKCINSLINQTYKEVEIILVDDGSPDRCPEICDQYAQEDKRIKVIHKTNGGLSDARNVGLKEATGEYVLFVDSDDYIQEDTCERFVSIMGNNRPDIVVGNAYRLEGNKKYSMEHKLNTNGKMIEGIDYLKEELKGKSMYMAAWLNLYRTRFLLENKLQFSVGLLHEDEDFTPRAFLKAKAVIGTNLFFYNYMIREDSITMKKDLSKNGLHIIKICHKLDKEYDCIIDKELKELLKDNLVTKYLYAIQIGKLHKRKYKNNIDKKFLKKNVLTKRNKNKLNIFFISRYGYYYLNKLMKLMIDINEGKE